WLTNAAGLFYGSAISSAEAPFAATVMTMAALIVRDLKTDGAHPWLWPAIGFLAGASYGLRYAGLSLLPGVAAYIVWRWWKTRKTAWGVAGLTAAGLLTFTIQVRNIVYTGSWRGGFTGGGLKLNLRDGIAETIKAFYHIAFGGLV